MPSAFGQKNTPPFEWGIISFTLVRVQYQTPFYTLDHAR